MIEEIADNFNSCISNVSAFKVNWRGAWFNVGRFVDQDTDNIKFL